MVPLAEFAAQCRRFNLPGFLQLADLLGDDMKAAKALRAEGEFIKTPEWQALNAPLTAAFAKQVRTFLLQHKLDWNSENLLAGCKHVLAGGRGA